ncbi:iron-containing alcohol dehydrogenase [Metabacillus litoralis]|uniref:iron-containing alcohol dehydrogenase n=1 Tax=Metabacillus litoralis TaxID=152268 RepID=UPI001B92F977|nr:iron-containing alcohol dehydrogenase [Metabacillus litoralis]MCM3408654.1 iron-containing alcohol dehydrogenase [Metabacillus litoralis]UHA59686.1 iron-containing alcohol dehydrogenase [Metabacillus litoralis]
MLTLSSFRYEVPTIIEFGRGAVHELPKHVEALGGNKALIVGDPGVLQAGIVNRVEEPLEKAGIPYMTFTDVGIEASIESVDYGVEMAKRSGCDIVVGVGGGSALDTAKSIGIMLKHEGNIRDYIGLDKVPSPGASVIAIPTTAGTGSEMTRFAVLSDKKAKAKLSVGSMFACPTLALCDPELTTSLPPHITAATGMDALTHALESFVNKATQPISEGLSIQSMKLISKSIRLAVSQGENMDARQDMLMASTIAAMAFNTTRLGLAHALAIPLGAHFKIPHGVVNAILLPEVMKFNIIGNTEKFAEIARIFGEKTDHLSTREAAERAVVAIKLLNKDIGITQTLSDYGVEEQHLDLIVDEAILSGNVPVNPVKPTKEDLKNICRGVMSKHNKKEVIIG